MTERGEAKRFLENALRAQSSDCIVWPYSKKDNGYPDIKWKGRMYGAHRLAWESRNGPPPSPLHEAAHSCNNRACINPIHLRWATHKENHGDRHAHGTIRRGAEHPHAKLTPEKVRAISTGTTWGWLT